MLSTLICHLVNNINKTWFGSTKTYTEGERPNTGHESTKPNRSPPDLCDNSGIVRSLDSAVNRYRGFELDGELSDDCSSTLRLQLDDVITLSGKYIQEVSCYICSYIDFVDLSLSGILRM